ncbi:MAG: hypothetical protein ACRDZO_04835 [Egibacteraceae bacterium]
MPQSGREPEWSGRYTAVVASHGEVPAQRLRLHIDIDGAKPLGVVSGTVRGGNAAAHFIGQVTRDEWVADARELDVTGFSLDWPGASAAFERLRLRVRRHEGRVVAEGVLERLSGTGESVSFVAQRRSQWFRKVEIDVDVEDGAPPLEPYATDSHPDRPTRLAPRKLTFEAAFAEAGIRLTRLAQDRDVVDTSQAGEDHAWNSIELHDSMERHWEAFGNRPQWKAWLFFAVKAERKRLGGLMFDANLDERGGIDRQGVAVFTGCEYFFSPHGGYVEMNPPSIAAAQRELLFTTVHELGHVFNLPHAFEPRSRRRWDPPPWMRPGRRRQALTWMNYPNNAMPDQGANASWFYQRFTFSFTRQELLFLRHAPDRDVQMGGPPRARGHERAGSAGRDRRLELAVRARKWQFELGEPVVVELRLRNVGSEPVPVYANLNPSDGLVEVVITGPERIRQRYIPLVSTRIAWEQRRLEPGGNPLYAAVDLTVGRSGFPFKRPGRYRISMRYTNLDGSVATAAMNLAVRAPSPEAAAVQELFDARVGRVLYVGGTRVMEDVNDKLDWVRSRLDPRHPVALHLATTRVRALARPVTLVGTRTTAARVLEPEPDRVIAELAPVVLQHEAALADTIGHINMRKVVDMFATSAVDAGSTHLAVDAEQRMLELFRSRQVLPSVVASVENRLAEIKGAR